MLPAQARVRRRAEHRLVAARGRRTRSGPILAHLLLTGEGPARAGFVVGRRTGPAVVRNRIRRQLRELVRARLAELPVGAMLVVRALPEAGQADWMLLGRSLDRVLGTLLAAGPRRGPGSARPTPEFRSERRNPDAQTKAPAALVGEAVGVTVS